MSRRINTDKTAPPHIKRAIAQQRIDNMLPYEYDEGCLDCDLEPSTHNLQICKRCGCGYADIPGYGKSFLSRDEVKVWTEND